MSKTRAVHWPVLVASSLPSAKLALNASSRPSVLDSGSRQCSNIGKRRSLPRTAIARIASRSQPPASQLLAPGSNWRLQQLRSKSDSTRHRTPRNSQDTVQCMCYHGYFSRYFREIPSSRISPTPISQSNQTKHRQSRGFHSSTKSKAVEQIDDTTSIRLNKPQRKELTSTISIGSTELSNKSSPVPKFPGIKDKVTALKNQNTPTKSNLASCPDIVQSDRTAMTISNFRFLIHTDHPHAKQLRRKTLEYRKKLISQHQIPSSIVPPLSAITSLFNYLEESNHLDQLTELDWNSYVYWLSYHKDDNTLGHLHQIALQNREIGSKINTTSYNILVNARLMTLKKEQTARNNKTQASRDPDLPQRFTHQQLPICTFEDTIKWMEDIDVPRSLEIYNAWLRAAVSEKNWLEGIEAWKRVTEKEGQFPSPPASLTAYTIQCYIRTGNMAEAAKLLTSILEQLAASQQSRVFGRIPRLESINSEHDNEAEFGTGDEWIGFQRRQKLTLQGLAALQQKSAAIIESDWVTAEVLDKSYIQEWEAVINPALIEAICLGNEDKHAVSLVCDLALDLFRQGHVLDKVRFRLLTRYVGACNGSEGAESFLRRMVELTRMSSTNKDSHGSSNGRDSRKMKKVVESASRILAEVGLQEIVKQATTEQNFERARKIFDGMAAQKIPIGLDTSEKLIVGLTKNHDYRSALAVLDKSLQDKKIPSIETANILLRGLFSADLLDESVAVFRELTETYEMKPDAKMYRELLTLTSSHGQLGMTQRILSTLESLGVKRDGKIYQDLMLCYVRSENLEGAIKTYHAMEMLKMKNHLGHINVLLEGAVRLSSAATVIGILEIMSSQRIRPSPETWNILLSGSLRAKDKILSQELFQELTFAVIQGPGDKSDGALRAARFPETFQMLVVHFSDRHGVEPTLRLLKDSLDAEFPSQVAPSLYRELIDKSCKQGKGIAGYEYFRLLRKSERVSDHIVRKIPPQYRKKPRSFTSPTAITSSSTSAKIPSLSNLYKQLMDQLNFENQLDIAKEMATDLILSGYEMNQDLVAGAIRSYARTGELTAAFGLFTKMGRVYGVDPSRDMVQTLYESSRIYGLLDSAGNSIKAASSNPSSEEAKWDENSVQLWMKALKASMEKFGVYDVDSMWKWDSSSSSSSA
ncbi:hypothetical protein BGZ76_002989 [Entomortierella beljakovae]|nr:hypothetical protein BGZ76_002989 [Entomortierella beljakovae]